jgi:hypothetical protein
MIRSAYVFAALVSLIAGPALAGEAHNSDIGYSSSNLVKSSFSAGRVAVEIFAGDRVDVASLVAGIDLEKSASAQLISDRLNEKRQLLYPDEEIILSITPPQTLPATGSVDKIGLVKAIYWWNNVNCSTCYWYAQYTSTVATMVIDDVQYGAYNLYDKIGTGNWVFRYLTRSGGSSTRYSFGSSALRGFKGAAAGVNSKADIVIYFFN